MMRIAVSAIALLACTSLASAADLGGGYAGSMKDDFAAPMYKWTGLYVGGHAGWLTGGWDGKMETSAANTNYQFDDRTKHFDGNNWLGGLQIGFNRQHGLLVWGIEADFSWTDLNDQKELVPYLDLNEAGWNVKTKLEQFGTVRGRLGFLVNPNFLLYGTGGFAWGKAKADLKVNLYHPSGEFVRVTANGSADENHLGWAAGLGGEYMLADNWTIRGEWLHVDLGKEDYHLKGTRTSDGKPHVTDSFPADLTFDVFRIGVNYKFGH